MSTLSNQRARALTVLDSAEERGRRDVLGRHRVDVPIAERRLALEHAAGVEIAVGRDAKKSVDGTPGEVTGMHDAGHVEDARDVLPNGFDVDGRIGIVEPNVENADHEVPYSSARCPMLGARRRREPGPRERVELHVDRERFELAIDLLGMIYVGAVDHDDRRRSLAERAQTVGGLEHDSYAEIDGPVRIGRDASVTNFGPSKLRSDRELFWTGTRAIHRRAASHWSESRSYRRHGSVPGVAPAECPRKSAAAQQWLPAMPHKVNGVEPVRIQKYPDQASLCRSPWSCGTHSAR